MQTTTTIDWSQYKSWDCILTNQQRKTAKMVNGQLVVHLYQGISSQKYEILGRDGMQIDGDCMVHSLLCYDMADVRESIKWNDWVPCSDDCDCKA